MIFRRVVLLLFSVGLTGTVFAQNFIKDYKEFLLGPANGHITQKRKDLIDSTIKRLSLTLTSFKKVHARSLIDADTIFLVDFQAAEGEWLSQIIWNKNASCCYEYTWGLKNWKVVNKKFTIKPDASEMVQSFDTEFRELIELGDTIDYRKYAYKHRVFDGEWVSPVIAIKKGAKWTFTTFKSDGWAMDCFNSFNGKSTPLDTFIENLARSLLHLNTDAIDSTHIADTANSGNTFPVIVINGKVGKYSQLRQMELNKITSISLINAKAQKTALPYGIESNVGVILITTGEKTTHTNF